MYSVVKENVRAGEHLLWAECAGLCSLRWGNLESLEKPGWGVGLAELGLGGMEGTWKHPNLTSGSHPQRLCKGWSSGDPICTASCDLPDQMKVKAMLTSGWPRSSTYSSTMLGPKRNSLQEPWKAGCTQMGEP